MAMQSGWMVAVVGPSGAGKDTLMDAIARHFAGQPGLHIVRRVITRPEEAGGEDHLAVTREEFAEMKSSGAFATSWEAHGLCYGIPEEARARVKAGDIVIANGSRSALPHFRYAFPRLKVLNITAQPEVLAERLAARGRETRDEIMARLARGALDLPAGFDVRTIDNSGRIEDARAAAIAFVKDILEHVSA